jgi:hypothetical protein
MKRDAFNMMPKATTNLAMKTADVPTTQGNSRVEFTNEDNAHRFLRYHGYCSL